MVVDGGGWWWMAVDGSGWQWMVVDAGRWMVVDGGRSRCREAWRREFMVSVSLFGYCCWIFEKMRGVEHKKSTAVRGDGKDFLMDWKILPRFFAKCRSSSRFPRL